jgi:signal transduction histidine kinase
MRKRLRVLLIEDDPVYVRFIREMFKEIPDNLFHLQHAERLGTGLDMLKGGEVDIVLLDLMLPDSMRLDTVRRVVEYSPQVPIVVLTTIRDEQTGIAAVQTGAQDYLFKGEVSGPLLSRALRYALERKQVEEAIKQVNRNLSLMNSITRHDILNQLTIILGYLPLIKESAADEKQREYIHRMELAADAIHRQIEFTRDYQSIGAQSPQWQNIEETVTRAIHGLDLTGVTINLDLENVEVYADPMLERVFYNLFDNALKHGGNVTGVGIHCCEAGDGIQLIWQDNGAGIPKEDKERIFRRGVGRNHGFGLFLIRSILAITGIEIRETGDPGKGARFEIHIPRGYFRMIGKE